MSRRARQMRRRSRRGPSRAVFLVLGALVAGSVLAVCAGLGYIVSVAATAPDLTELKPVDQGATSAVYAADGTRLGFIQGNVLRTPIPSTRIPDTMRQATVAIEDRRFYKHGGVDFEGVVRAAIKNIASGKTVEGGSTLTMQLIRNLYTESRARKRHRGLQAKGPRGQARLRARGSPPGAAGQGLGPQHIPQQRPLRNRRRPDRRRRRGGVAHLLRQAGAAPDAGRVGAARGPAAGAVALQPVPRPGRGDHPPQRGPAADGQGGLHHAGQRDPRAAREAEGQEEPLLRQAPRELLLRLRQAAADRRVRRRARAPGRAQGLYDGRPQAPAGGAQGDRRAAAEPGRPVRRARLDGSEERLHQGDGEFDRVLGLEVQPRRAGQAPARARRSRSWC